MTKDKIHEIEDYIRQLTPAGFGLSIGGDQKIVDIFFETLTPEEVTSIKQNLQAAFPNAVYFN